MTVKLLTEHHLEFLSLKGGCTGSSESSLVKMPHCWESHVMVQIIFYHNQFTCSELFVSSFIIEQTQIELSCESQRNEELKLRTEC